MSLKQELYEALLSEYPTATNNAELSRQSGVTYSMLQRLEEEKGLGVDVANKLFKRNPIKYFDIHSRTMRAKNRSNKEAGHSKSRSSLDISKMSTHAQFMCGFIGR